MTKLIKIMSMKNEFQKVVNVVKTWKKGNAELRRMRKEHLHSIELRGAQQYLTPVPINWMIGAKNKLQMEYEMACYLLDQRFDKPLRLPKTNKQQISGIKAKIRDK